MVDTVDRLGINGNFKNEFLMKHTGTFSVCSYLVYYRYTKEHIYSLNKVNSLAIWLMNIQVLAAKKRRDYFGYRLLWPGISAIKN